MQEKTMTEEEAGTLVPRPTPSALYGDAELAGGYSTAGAFDIAPMFWEYWRLLRKHKWQAISIVVAVVALGMLRTLMMTPLYTASARLQIDRGVARVVENGNITPLEGGDVEFLRTQYELLQGSAIAERAVSTLKLAEEPEFIGSGEVGLFAAIRALFGSPAHSPDASERAAREQAAAARVLANRAIKPVTGSRLVDIAYTDPSPRRAQKIAAGLAQAFVDLNLDKRFQVNAFAKSFLEDQIKQLQIRLQESEKSLVEFGQREQIITTNEKSSISENSLAAGNAALGQLAAERIRNEQLYKQIAQANAINLPQFLSNKVVEDLREKRNTLVAEYQEKLETFKPSYPGMIQISNKIKEIDRQIDTEIKAVRDSYKGAYEASLNQENEMKARVEALRAEVLDLQERSIKYNILKREVDTNRALYEHLLQRYKEVDVASGAGANNMFIVEQPHLPSAPSSPQTNRNLAVSLALGVAAAALYIFLVEKFDDTVSSAEELERLTGLVTLGLIPQVDGDNRTIDQELAELRSGVCEAYRSLCTSLHFATDSGLPKSLLVTSSAASEGKSTTALAIARHFATLGLKVLIIDADLRRPSLHERFGVDNGLGLSNYLSGGCSPPKAMQNTAINNLVFMPSGPIPPNPADLLASARFMTLLTVGAEVFDLIVIDSPPVLGLADAQLLSNVAAATVFVIRSGGTRKGQLRHSLKRLRFARANVVGAVLTRQDTKTGGYGYGYGYGDGYGYGRDEAPEGRITAEAEAEAGAGARLEERQA
jgi:capsular exopolysaccharide synthesis family protein